MISPEALSALCQKARLESVGAAHAVAEQVAAERAAFLKRVCAAQDELVGRITEGLEETVMAAARTGKRYAEALSFSGPEKFQWVPEGEELKDEHTFSYLFLVKGPRDEREELAGFKALVARLREELAPFAVRHDWDQSTNRNAVLVSW